MAGSIIKCYTIQNANNTANVNSDMQCCSPETLLCSHHHPQESFPLGGQLHPHYQHVHIHAYVFSYKHADTYYIHMYIYIYIHSHTHTHSNSIRHHPQRTVPQGNTQVHHAQAVQTAGCPFTPNKRPNMLFTQQQAFCLPRPLLLLSPLLYSRAASQQLCQSMCCTL